MDPDEYRAHDLIVGSVDIRPQLAAINPLEDERLRVHHVPRSVDLSHRFVGATRCVARVVWQS
jgi:hypothetical protein